MDQSLSQYGMTHMRVGFTSGDDDDSYFSNNEANNANNNTASDFDSGVEKAERGEQLHRMDTKTKRKKKKKISSEYNSPNLRSTSAVPSLYEIAQRHKQMDRGGDDEEYDSDENQSYDYQSGKIDEAEYRELFKIPYESAFTKIVTNQVDRSIIEPFLNMHTDAQQKSLDKLMNEEVIKRQQGKFNAQRRERDVGAPAARFARIEEQLRMGLRREASSCSDLLFLVQLEQELTTYVNEQQALLLQQLEEATFSVLPLVLSFSESFYRFLCHGVCQYYGLQSVSVDHTGGKRVTMITMPKNYNSSLNEFVLPSVSLYQYLGELSGKGNVMSSPSVDPQVLSETKKHQRLDSQQFLSARGREVVDEHANNASNKQQQQQRKKKKYRRNAFGIKQW